MRFKMKQTASAALMLAALAGCSHKPVVTRTTTDPALSVVCQRPGGSAPLSYNMSFVELRKDAAAYQRSLQLAAKKRHGQGKPLPTDFMPMSHVVRDGLAVLDIAYHPYIDPQTGYIRLQGNVSCGRKEVTTLENRSYYADGINNMPFNINAVESMTSTIQYQGVGGYWITMSREYPMTTTERLKH